MTDAAAEALVVLTTTGQRDDAERIAWLLVQERLAACVQLVGPIRSIYRWQGEIEAAEEWQLWIKTQRRLYARLEEAIRGAHPYQVPEILALPAAAGSAAYLRWLSAELAEE